MAAVLIHMQVPMTIEQRLLFHLDLVTSEYLHRRLIRVLARSTSARRSFWASAKKVPRHNEKCTSAGCDQTSNESLGVLGWAEIYLR